MLLYVPNLIGYVRIILTLSCLWTHEKYPLLTFLLYATSVTLDWFDGIYARKLNQCSKFGTMLDIITDKAVQHPIITGILIQHFP